MKNIFFVLLTMFLLFSCQSNGEINTGKTLIPKIEDVNFEHYKKIEKIPLISEDEMDSFLISPKIEKRDDSNRNFKDKKILLSEDIDYIVRIIKQNKNNKNNLNNNKKKDEKKDLSYNINKDDEIITYKEYSGPEYNFKESSNTEITENIPKKYNIEDKKFDLTNIDNLKIIEKELIEVIREENKSLKISLKDSGWIIKSIKPEIIELTKRENSSNYTLFDFFLSNIGEVSITFIRFDEKNSTVIRQPYRIVIKPKEIISKEKKETKEDKNKNKAQKEDDQRKILANRLFEQKRFDEALSLYNELINEGKSDSEIFYKRGKIYLYKEKLNEAYSDFLENLKEKDNIYYNDSLIEVINILKKQKKYSEAINSYFKYWKGDVDNPKIDILLAGIYFEMEDYNTAANEYRKYLAKYPDSEFDDVVLFYLAYSIENYKTNPDFKEAYRLYKLLVSKYPESKYYNKSKSRMLYLERHYLKVN